MNKMNKSRDVTCFVFHVTDTTGQMESILYHQSDGKYLWPLCLASVACFLFQVPELSRCQEKKSEPGRFEPTAPLLLAGTLTPALAGIAA